MWSDTCISNAEFDQLYDDQRAATSPDDRAAIVKQMQEILYTQVPEVVLWYDNDLQAWNSDKWTGFQLQPTPNADGDGGYALFQYGTYSYENIQPVRGSGAGIGHQLRVSPPGCGSRSWPASRGGGHRRARPTRGSDEDKA